MIDRYCIVRCRDAGVWAGVVKQLAGRAVLLADANRIWAATGS